VVAKPASDDTVVHHRLVRLVLEVGLPACLEVRSRPGLKLFEFGVSRADLDAGFDAIGGQGTGSLDVPFLKDAWIESVWIGLEADEGTARFWTSGSPRAKSSKVSVPGLAR
jgi:hypothetical protein